MTPSLCGKATRITEKDSMGRDYTEGEAEAKAKAEAGMDLNYVNQHA